MIWTVLRRWAGLVDAFPDRFTLAWVRALLRVTALWALWWGLVNQSWIPPLISGVLAVPLFGGMLVAGGPVAAYQAIHHAEGERHWGRADSLHRGDGADRPRADGYLRRLRGGDHDRADHHPEQVSECLRLWGFVPHCDVVGHQRRGLDGGGRHLGDDPRRGLRLVRAGAGTGRPAGGWDHRGCRCLAGGVRIDVQRGHLNGPRRCGRGCQERDMPRSGGTAEASPAVAAMNSPLDPPPGTRDSAVRTSEACHTLSIPSDPPRSQKRRKDHGRERAVPHRGSGYVDMTSTDRDAPIPGSSHTRP